MPDNSSSALYVISTDFNRYVSDPVKCALKPIPSRIVRVSAKSGMRGSWSQPLVETMRRLTVDMVVGKRPNGFALTGVWIAAGDIDEPADLLFQVGMIRTNRTG